MQEFILPDIGEGIVECELLEWLVQEGQIIQEDDPVAEVMTDKATVQIPAMYSGKVVKLHYKVGDIAKVHAPLFAMIPVHHELVGSQVVENEDADNHVEQIEVQTQEVEKNIQPNPPTQSANEKTHPHKVLASPAVRRIAKEQGIDIQTIVGSGKKGRVLKDDLLEHKHDIVTSKGKATANPEQNHTSSDRVVPLRGVQAAMAKHMVHSTQTIPHFSVTDECAVQALLDMRSALKPEFALHGIKLTLLPFMFKALSLSINEYPIINSQVSHDMKEVIYKGQHNIGFAVDTPQGLLVPNIKDVAQKSLFEIAQEVQALVKLAKTGDLSSTDLQGGTITISNIGAIGGLVATPVINHPEVAIVALGKIQHLPRFDEQGKVYSQATMHVSWSGDHRVIDGATMVKFNNLWLKYLQQPAKMLAHLR